MGDRKKAKQFHQFINELRVKRDISMERLCEGLCSRRMVCYLERGERAPDKLLQDRILERLGVGAEDYEYFLFYDEYDRWEARQRILHNITWENRERAKRLLHNYRMTYDMNNPLERQFCLSMQAQIQRCQGESPEALGRLFEEAVRLTVPNLGNKTLSKLALSLKELNLILEAEQYRQEGERPQQYQEIADYILSNGFDGTSVAKLYPKAVYFLYRSVEKGTDPDWRKLWTDNKLLSHCNRALAILREHLRMYYLWEILDMREKLLERISQKPTLQWEPKRAASLAALCLENIQWKKALEKTYSEFQVSKETFEYCYLYVVRGVSCINDVVRIRRKMFGMSRKELCDGICDIATLRRLEQRKTATHREIAEKLFQRLGLSTEFARSNLVTASYEAKQMMMQLRKYVNERKWDDARMLQEQIESLIAMDIPSNRQVMMRQEATFCWYSGEISRDEYLSRMRAALELTLPYKIFYSEGEKYLTNEEQVCIQNMMQVLDEASDEYAVCAENLETLYLPYAENELLEAVANLYEFVMGNIGSWRGNRGDFDRSDQYNTTILLGCLHFRRTEIIARSLYGRWWNYYARKEQGIPTNEILDDMGELTRCISFSQLSKQHRFEQFLQKKLAGLVQKS